jgi:hypothetical protein
VNVPLDDSVATDEVMAADPVYTAGGRGRSTYGGIGIERPYLAIRHASLDFNANPTDRIAGRSGLDANSQIVRVAKFSFLPERKAFDESPIRDELVAG